VALLDVIPQLPAGGVLGNLPGPLGIFAPQQQDFQPVVEKNAANETALTNKVTKMRDFYAGLDPHVRDALVQFDANRVHQGTAPLNEAQTIAAANAAQARKLPTEGTKRSMWNLPGNLVSDARSVIGSIPKLLDPRMWINEVTSLPHIGDSISAARAGGADPLQAVFQAPGLRMLPGSFIAGNALHPAELLRHPLFTGLDVAPGLEAFAKTRPVVQEAGRLAKAADVALAGLEHTPENYVPRAVLEHQAREVPALRTWVKSKLDAEGNIVPTKLAGYVNDVATRTRGGQAISEAFGEKTRWAMGETSKASSRIAGVRDGLIEAADPLEQLTRDSAKLAEEYGQEMRVAVTRKMQLGDKARYTDAELPMVHAYREITNRYARDLQARTGEVIEMNGEFYPRAQAEKITNTRARSDVTKRIAGHRAEYMNPTGTRVAEDWHAEVDHAMTNTVRRTRKHQLDAQMRAMDAHGFDTGRGSPARVAMDKAESSRGGFDGVAGHIKEAIDQGPVHQRIPMLDIIKSLHNTPLDAQAKALAYAIADGNTGRITEALDNLMSRKGPARHAITDMPGAVDTIRSYRDRVTWDNKYGSTYTARKAERYGAAAERLTARTVPARWGPNVQAATIAKTVDHIKAGLTTPADVEAITRSVTESNWADVDKLTGNEAGSTQALYSGIEKEVAATWQEMRDSGLDPEFVHRVSRSQAGQVARPQVGVIPTKITQTMERTLDMSPGTDDWAIALSHQGMEQLSRRATETVIDHIMERFGVKQSDLQAQFSHLARNADSPLNFQQQLTDIIGSQYTRFNPAERGYSWGGARLQKYDQDAYFIPKSLANNLQRIASPKGLLGGAIDPVTQTFRVAVVGLSPRTQLYNILGGAVMLFGQTGPGAFKYWSEARQLVGRERGKLKSAGSTAENEIVRTMLGSMKAENFEVARVQANAGVLMGKTAHRLLKQAGENGALTKAKGGFNSLIEKSFDLNGLFDDQYRAMAYLYGHDKAIAKGLSKGVAERAGEELLRRTMMDWTTLTPIERNVFKTVFPFYGFMRHAVQYVMRYPVDHPLRASVLGAFGKAETDDLHGLPLNFLSMIPFGGESASGHQNYLSMGAVNPFNGVPDLFTLSGYLSATNPLIATALESVGLSSRGEAELYPTLTYDPETGRLGAKHPNALMALAANTIPQTQLLTSLLGVNKDFNDRIARDPAGANRSLLANGGLPILWRDFDIPQEYFKAEVARTKSVNDSVNAAKTSGDWSGASDSPTLQAALDKLRAQTPDQTAAMVPQTTDALTQQINNALAGQAQALSNTPGSSAGIYG